MEPLIIKYGPNILYDGSKTYPAFNIKLSGSDSKGCSMTFDMPLSNPNASRLSVMDAYNAVTLSFGNPQYNQYDKHVQSVFAGYVTDISRNSDGVMHVTCEDLYWHLGQVSFRLADIDAVSSGAETAENVPTLVTKILLDAANIYNSLQTTPLQIKAIAYPNPSGASPQSKTYSTGTYPYPNVTIPNVLMTIDPSEEITMLDVMLRAKDALSEGGTSGICSLRLYQYPNGLGTSGYGIAFDMQTYQMQTYSYGIDLISIEADSSVDHYLNAMWVSGGVQYKPASGAVTPTATMRMPSGGKLGAREVYLTNASADTTIRDGDLLSIGGVYYKAYLPSGDVSMTPSSGRYVGIQPYLQEDIPSGDTVSWYGNPRADGYSVEEVECIPTYSTAGGYRSQSSPAMVYHMNEVSSHGLMAGEFSDADIIKPSLLRQRAIEAIEPLLTVSDTIRVRFVGKKISTASDSIPLVMTGYNVTIEAEPVGVSGTYAIASHNISIDNLTQSSYTLGAARRSMTSRLDENRKLISSVARNAESRLRSATR